MNLWSEKKLNFNNTFWSHKRFVQKAVLVHKHFGPTSILVYKLLCPQKRSVKQMFGQQIVWVRQMLVKTKARVNNFWIQKGLVI